jgi:hypothetical protein
VSCDGGLHDLHAPEACLACFDWIVNYNDIVIFFCNVLSDIQVNHTIQCC